MKTQPTHLASLFGFLLFVLGALLFLVGGLILGISALTTFLVKDQTDAQSTVFFAALSFEGLILVIASVISFMKFLNKPAADTPVSLSFSNSQILVGIIGSGLALWIGSQIQDVDSLNWIILPFLTIPAVALPIWTILGMGTRNTSPNSSWRTWGVFGISMTLVPFILIVLEIFIALGVFIVILAYVVAQPDLMAELQRLSTQFIYIDPESSEALELLAPFLTRPGTIMTVLIYFSILIPLVEELFKPLGVWMLAGKLNTSSQGFVFGALSGAGYALVETINVSGQVGEWGSLLFTRIGTGLLHITTSAIMGAAIVMAWRERRYLRLLGTYLLAVLLHGLWNAAAVTYGFSTLTGTFEQTSRFDTLQTISIVSMIVLVITFMVILLVTNYKLRDRVVVNETIETTQTDNTNDSQGVQ
jgi:hypothetical protein